MPKVDSFQAIVSPSMVPPSGNGGGAEVGSLEENPFKGMQSSGVEEEQKVASGVHLSGAGGEAEGTRAPKRRRKGSSKADKVSMQEHSVCVSMCVCLYSMCVCEYVCVCVCVCTVCVCKCVFVCESPFVPIYMSMCLAGVCQESQFMCTFNKA